jgi:hypothetical protein
MDKICSCSFQRIFLKRVLIRLFLTNATQNQTNQTISSILTAVPAPAVVVTSQTITEKAVKKSGKD